MHPTLIQANIALFQGERAACLRLLAAYRQEQPADDSAHTLVLWLEAQAQADDTSRKRHLLALVGAAPAGDPYGQLAREALESESAYQLPAPPPRRGLWIGVGVTALLLIGLTAWLLRPGPSAVPTATLPGVVAVAATLTPTAPPDQSRPLVASSFTARYDAGLLQVTALEDRSLRVVDARTGEPLTPIAGARFFALAIDFECRAGICSEPPQAVLTVQTENEAAVPVREGAAVVGEPTLTPVALGRSTNGWLVFELPSLSRVEALHITPLDADEGAPPLVIELPGL